MSVRVVGGEVWGNAVKNCRGWERVPDDRLPPVEQVFSCHRRGCVGSFYL